MLRNWMLGSTLGIAVSALGAVAVGCGEGGGAQVDELTVELQVVNHHIHTFATDVAFTAAVADQAGEPVRDFSILRVEIAPAGSESWRQAVPLVFDGLLYRGSTRFTAVGAFDVRLVGQRPDQPAPLELQRLAEPLNAIREHWSLGGYRVEFETDRGDYPIAGVPVTVRFLIMQDVDSPRPPVEGLAGVTIRCTQESELEVHAAVEQPAGTYSATHTFDEAGVATALLELPGLDGDPAFVQMPLEVRAPDATGP